MVNKVDGFCPQAMYSGDNITCKVAGASTRPVFLTRGLRQVNNGGNVQCAVRG